MILLTEVKDCLYNFDETKGQSPDGIPSSFIKNALQRLANFLLCI